jgi:hypothetical protein
MGRCRPGATSRAAWPTAAPADRSRRSSAPMSDVPDAVWVCAPPPTRTPRCGWRARPPGVQRHPGAEPRLLGQAEPASQERQLPPFGCAWSRSTARVLACYVEDRAVPRDSCTAWRWDRVAAVVDQQLRARAGSSSGKLADLVREVVVQEAQRERVAEQALQAGPNRAGPTYRGPGPDPARPGRTGASRRPERLGGGWRW